MVLEYMAVSILYLRSQWLLNGPPRHLLPWARIPRVCWLGPEPQGTPNHTFLSPNGSPWHHLGPGDRAQGQNFAANVARGAHPLNLTFCFTILDFKTGIRLRIPARISPWVSGALNPNFLMLRFGLQNAKN